MLHLLRLLLPALIPSWRFFKTIQPAPRVEWRMPGGDWQPFEEKPQNLSLWHLLVRLIWSPDRNEALYMVSLSERLVGAPTSHSFDEIQRRVAYKAGAPPGSTLFRLVFTTRVDGQLQEEVIFSSEPPA